MLKAVLFDLGDTLIDFEPMDTRGIFRLAAKDTYEFLTARGFSPPAFDLYCRKQFRAIRWSYLWAKLRRRDFNSLHILLRYCRSIDANLSDEQLHELAWLWYAPLVTRSTVEDGLVDALTTLRDRGYKLGLISNTFIDAAVHDRHLALVGLREFFPVRIYSSGTGYRKPHRRIFQLALEQFGVTPTEAVFVGDLVKTDMIGARRMGMTTILKRPWGNAKSVRAADFVVRSIGEVPAVVAQLAVRPSGLPLNGESVRSTDPAPQIQASRA